MAGNTVPCLDSGGDNVTSGPTASVEGLEVLVEVFRVVVSTAGEVTCQWARPLKVRETIVVGRDW